MARNVFSNTTWPRLSAKIVNYCTQEGVFQVDDIRVGTYWGTPHSNSVVRSWEQRIMWQLFEGDSRVWSWRYFLSGSTPDSMCVYMNKVRMIFADAIVTQHAVIEQNVNSET